MQISHSKDKIYLACESTAFQAITAVETSSSVYYAQQSLCCKSVNWHSSLTYHLSRILWIHDNLESHALPYWLAAQGTVRQ